MAPRVPTCIMTAPCSLLEPAQLYDDTGAIVAFYRPVAPVRYQSPPVEVHGELHLFRTAGRGTVVSFTPSLSPEHRLMMMFADTSPCDGCRRHLLHALPIQPEVRPLAPFPLPTLYIISLLNMAAPRSLCNTCISSALYYLLHRVPYMQLIFFSSRHSCIPSLSV